MATITVKLGPGVKVLAFAYVDANDGRHPAEDGSHSTANFDQTFTNVKRV